MKIGLTALLILGMLAFGYATAIHTSDPFFTVRQAHGAALDTIPPSVPQNVQATPVSNSQIKVTWNASTDNIGVVGYNVYQDGNWVVSVNGGNTYYTIIGLTPPTKHTYTVSAYDALGNQSAQSVGATASIAAPVLSAYDKLVLADSPVGFWDVDPKTSTETDLSGDGNTGTYVNGLPALATLPDGEPAADFNGSNQYLTVPSNRSFSIPTTGSLTWEAWIRPDVLQFPKSNDEGYVDFMGKCAFYSPTCEWEARMYDSTTMQAGRSDRISAYVFNPTAGFGSAADWQPSLGQIQAGQWIQVVGEYTTQNTPSNCADAGSYPGSINIWVNGVEWSEVSHAPTGCMSQYGVVPKANNSPLNIATMGMDYFFKGAIGKVAIYNYRLTTADIDAQYEAMTGKEPVGTCGATCIL